MNQVDFYILTESSQKNINHICCQLCEKALKSNLTILIYTQSAAQAEELDNLLWSYKSNSFIAHKNMYNQYDIDHISDNTLTKSEAKFQFLYPVLITGEVPVDHKYNDVLINLNSTPPPFYANFKRVAEMVDKELLAKESARSRYRFYQQQNCKLNKYDL